MLLVGVWSTNMIVALREWHSRRRFLNLHNVLLVPELDTPVPPVHALLVGGPLWRRMATSLPWLGIL